MPPPSLFRPFPFCCLECACHHLEPCSWHHSGESSEIGRGLHSLSRTSAWERKELLFKPQLLGAWRPSQPNLILTIVGPWSARQIQFYLNSSPSCELGVLVPLSGIRRRRLNKNEATCPHTRASIWIRAWSLWLQISGSLILALVINVKREGHVAHSFVTFVLWQSPNFVDFFKKTLGFSEKFICGFLKVTNMLTVFQSIILIRKTFFLNFKESCVVPLVSSVYFIVVC